jgi:hypothetical protein
MQNFSFHYALNHESVSAERMNGEYMLIHFDTGTYFSVTDLGADIISLISARQDRNSWKQLLIREWKIDPDFDLENAIDDFLNVLKERNLIYEIDSFQEGEIQLPKDLDRTQFRFPPLAAYTDMADLLMVDPIHDSSLMGWPEKPILD